MAVELNMRLPDGRADRVAPAGAPSAAVPLLARVESAANKFTSHDNFFRFIIGVADYVRILSFSLAF